MKNLIAAFQFLTVLPLPVKTGREHLERSMPWFPLVGAVTGLVVGFGYKWSALIFPGPVAAVPAILLYIVFTRGLHLDGFMDTIDGFFCHRDRERTLAVMKDPAVGAFAVLGAGCWFLSWYAALPLLTPADHVLIHTCGRTAVLLMPLLVGYPRESGTGKFFVQNVTPRTLVSALFLLLGILAALIYSKSAGFVRPAEGIATATIYGGLVLGTFVSAALIAFWSKRKIGGITGDVLGFTIEIIHLAGFLTLAATA